MLLVRRKRPSISVGSDHAMSAQLDLFVPEERVFHS